MTGDTIIIYLKYTGLVLRIERFGNVVESMSILDNQTLRKVSDIRRAFIPFFTEELQDNLSNEILIELDIEKEPENTINFYYEKDLMQAETFYPLPIYANKDKLFQMDINKFVNGYYFVKYFGQLSVHFLDKIKTTLDELIIQGIVSKAKADEFLQNTEVKEDNQADRGFYSNEKKLVVFTDQEIFGTLFYKSAIQNQNISKLFNGEIKVGDYIVHDLHGVGIYRGITSQEVCGVSKDYIHIEYLNNENLYVPYDNSNKVSKFIGEGGTPRLTKLGSAEWDTIRAKAKKDIEQIADELLDLYARRELEKGYAYDIERNREMFDQLISDFGYTDTPDQRKTTTEIIEDMESEKPMDRLLVGDVGFGKTEIAVRAAFLAVLNKKQVVVVAPTTILVSQLHKVFNSRLSKYGVNISKVSRFEGEKNNKESIEKLNLGKLDIIVGTHRLLSADVKPLNMGLLIIDEEQRFGVKQKEKIKSVKSNIDVLSMSATPIPRTLQMSLSGIRDISVISTPPPGRLSVKTQLISKGDFFAPVRTEIARGGQVFIVHNNISTIYTLEQKIKENVPEARIIVGHAKMSGDKLEKIMIDFANKEYDVLIATTIIENGIDIPAVNTMIIDDAHNFGLSQLHQLRGRVGRSSVQAYCYLVVPYTLKNGSIDDTEIKRIKKELLKVEKRRDDDDDFVQKKKKGSKDITLDGIERIKAIIEHQALGSGFHIANKDLEIRGGGNILSSSQSGHINNLGYDMYLRMLYQEINKKKNQAGV